MIGASTEAAWNHALATFTVTTTNDSGAGSLRTAITNANAAAGTDTINFSIVGAGVHTINLTSALPTITGAVTIDGYTQTGSSVNTLSVGDNAVLTIELNGTGAGGEHLVHGEAPTRTRAMRRDDGAEDPAERALGAEVDAGATRNREVLAVACDEDGASRDLAGGGKELHGAAHISCSPRAARSERRKCRETRRIIGKATG